MKFSRTEIKDLLKAWIAISLAFTVVNVGFSFNISFLVGFFMSGLTVGIGFLAHELAHKYVAQRFHCIAEFRSFDSMLVLALFLSIFGFVFVAPGAVVISGFISRKNHGKIAAAGAAANLALALIFLLLFLLGLPLLTPLASYGFMINSFLALFNLLPFWNFDGLKVLEWSRVAYIILITIAGIFMIIQGLL